MAKFSKKLIITVIIAVVVIAGVAIKLFSGQSKTSSDVQWGSSQKLNQWLAATGATTTANTEKLNDLPKSLFSEEYVSDKYYVSFRYPEDFKIGELPSGEQQVIIVQHPQKQIGVQVTITPLDEETKLTKEVINEQLPDYEVKNPQPVSFGDQKRGLVFKSNNDAFGGNSREIWFTYKQNLYQITSYRGLDPFVKTFFKTWKFN